MYILQTEYRKRGYNEVITPNMYNTKLWEKSGHLQNYEVSYFRNFVFPDNYITYYLHYYNYNNYY